MRFEDSDQLNRFISKQANGVTLLSFSNGKDSLLAWLVLRRYFEKIIPFYLYTIPGLEFIEYSLRYYEEYFKCHIIRLPHPSFYRMLNGLVYQSPEKCLAVELANLPDFDFDDVHWMMHEDLGLGKEVYVADGVGLNDSMTRRVALKRNGPVSVNRGVFHPIYDYARADLVRELTQAKILLPPEYALIARSFDGFNDEYLPMIKENYPRDWERIREFYGLIDMDILRMRFREDYYNGTETSDENYKV